MSHEDTGALVGVLAKRAPVDGATTASVSQIVDARYHKIQGREQYASTFPPWRRAIHNFVFDTPWFNRFIFTCVFLNCILVLLDKDGSADHTTLSITVFIILDVLTWIFALEAIVLMIASGVWVRKIGFFSSRTNTANLVLTIVALYDFFQRRAFPDTGEVRLAGVIARVGRLLRTFRTLAEIPAIRQLFDALRKSVSRLVDIMVLFIAFALVVGLVGMQFFERSLHYRCATPSWLNCSFTEPDVPCRGVLLPPQIAALSPIPELVHTHFNLSSFFESSQHNAAMNGVGHKRGIIAPEDYEIDPAMASLIVDDGQICQPTIAYREDFDLVGAWSAAMMRQLSGAPEANLVTVTIGDDTAVAELSEANVSQLVALLGVNSTPYQLPMVETNNWNTLLHGVSCAYSDVCVPWQNPEHGFISFDTVFPTFITMYFVTFLEGWSNICNFVIDARGGLSLYFFIFLVLAGALFMLNLVLAILVDAFTRSLAAIQQRDAAFKEMKEQDERDKANKALQAAKNGGGAAVAGASLSGQPITPPPTPPSQTPVPTPPGSPMQSLPPHSPGASTANFGGTIAALDAMALRGDGSSSPILSPGGGGGLDFGNDDGDNNKGNINGKDSNNQGKAADTAAPAMLGFRRAAPAPQQSIAAAAAATTAVSQKPGDDLDASRTPSNVSGTSTEKKPVRSSSRGRKRRDSGTGQRNNSNNNKPDPNEPPLLGFRRKPAAAAAAAIGGTTSTAADNNNTNNVDNSSVTSNALLFPQKQQQAQQQQKTSSAQALVVPEDQTRLLDLFAGDDDPLTESSVPFVGVVLSTQLAIAGASISKQGLVGAGRCISWFRQMKYYFRLIRYIVRSKIVTKTWFHVGSAILTLCNVVLLACVWHGMDAAAENGIFIATSVIALLFAIEITIKLIALPFVRLARDVMNIVDLVVSIAAIVEFTVARSTVVTTLRCIRILRLLSVVDSLRETVTVLRRGLVSTLPLIVVLLIFLYFYAVVGMALFSGRLCLSDKPNRFSEVLDMFMRVPTASCASDPGRPLAPAFNFDNFGNSLLATFVVFIGDNWASLLALSMERTSIFVSIWYVSCFTFAGFIVVNLFVAAMIEACAVSRGGDGDRLFGRRDADGGGGGPFKRRANMFLKDGQRMPTRQQIGQQQQQQNQQQQDDDDDDYSPILDFLPMRLRTLSTMAASWRNSRKNSEMNPNSSAATANDASNTNTAPGSPGGDSVSPNSSPTPPPTSARRRRGRSMQVVAIPGENDDEFDMILDGNDPASTNFAASLDGSPGGRNSVIAAMNNGGNNSDPIMGLQRMETDLGETMRTFRAMSQTSAGSANLKEADRQLAAVAAANAEQRAKMTPAQRIRRLARRALYGEKAYSATQREEDKFGKIMLTVARVLGVEVHEFTDFDRALLLPLFEEVRQARKFEEAKNALRRGVGYLIRHPLYRFFLTVAAAFSLVTYVSFSNARTAPNAPGNVTLAYTELINMLVLVLDVLFRIVSLGPYTPKATRITAGYFNSKLHIAQTIAALFCVAATICSFVGPSTATNALRVFSRCMPLWIIATQHQPTMLILISVWDALVSLGNVGFIAVLVWVTYGIMGTQLFRGTFYACSSTANSETWGDQTYLGEMIKTRAECLNASYYWVSYEHNFDNIWESMETLFGVATTDDWSTIAFMSASADVHEVAPVPGRNMAIALFACSFILIAALFLLNVFIAVLVNAYFATQERMERNLRNSLMIGEAGDLLDPAQRDFYDLYRRALCYVKKPPSVKFAHGTTRWWIRRVSRSNAFQVVFLVLSFVNVIVQFTAFTSAPPPPENLLIVDMAFTIVLFIMIVMKIVGSGITAVARESYWSIVEICVVALTFSCTVAALVFTFSPPTRFNALELENNLDLLGFLRQSRILLLHRVMSATPGARVLVDTIARSRRQLVSALWLLMLLFLTYSALGLTLFGRVAGRDEHTNFWTIPRAFYTLLTVATFDGWQDVMGTAAARPPNCDPQIGDCGIGFVSPLYFMTFIALGQWVGISLFVAILVESFSRSERQERLRVQIDDVKRFRRLWKKHCRAVLANSDATAASPMPISQLPLFLMELGAPLGPVSVQYAFAEASSRQASLQEFPDLQFMWGAVAAKPTSNNKPGDGSVTPPQNANSPPATPRGRATSSAAATKPAAITAATGKAATTGTGSSSAAAFALPGLPDVFDGLTRKVKNMVALATGTAVAATTASTDPLQTSQQSNQLNSALNSNNNKSFGAHRQQSQQQQNTSNSGGVNVDADERFASRGDVEKLLSKLNLPTFLGPNGQLCVAQYSLFDALIRHYYGVGLPPRSDLELHELLLSSFGISKTESAKQISKPSQKMDQAGPGLVLRRERGPSGGSSLPTFVPSVPSMGRFNPAQSDPRFGRDSFFFVDDEDESDPDDDKSTKGSDDDDDETDESEIVSNGSFADAKLPAANDDDDDDKKKTKNKDDDDGVPDDPALELLTPEERELWRQKQKELKQRERELREEERKRKKREKEQAKKEKEARRKLRAQRRADREKRRKQQEQWMRDQNDIISVENVSVGALFCILRIQAHWRGARIRESIRRLAAAAAAEQSSAASLARVAASHNNNNDDNNSDSEAAAADKRSNASSSQQSKQLNNAVVDPFAASGRSAQADGVGDDHPAATKPSGAILGADIASWLSGQHKFQPQQQQQTHHQQQHSVSPTSAAAKSADKNNNNSNDNDKCLQASDRVSNDSATSGAARTPQNALGDGGETDGGPPLAARGGAGGLLRRERGASAAKNKQNNSNGQNDDDNDTKPLPGSPELKAIKRLYSLMEKRKQRQGTGGGAGGAAASKTGGADHKSHGPPAGNTKQATTALASVTQNLIQQRRIIRREAAAAASVAPSAAPASSVSPTTVPIALEQPLLPPNPMSDILL